MANKTVTKKGSAKKGDAVVRSPRSPAAGAPTKSAAKPAAATARAPKRPAVPSRASKKAAPSKAAADQAPARKTAGTGAGKAGSKPLAGGRSLSKKAPARKSAAPTRAMRDNTPFGRGGKGTPPPGITAGKHVRNDTTKGARQASDTPSRQKEKPSRKGSGTSSD